MNIRPNIYWSTAFYVLLIVALLGLILRFSPAINEAREYVELEPFEYMPPEDIPDFESIVEVEAKKEAFFAFLGPYIERANQRILFQRERLQQLADKIRQRRPLSANERTFIVNLSDRYAVESEAIFTVNHLTRLLKRVDVIPVSLALVQGAIESAWGTSRFAREGNNFFGQWCYSEGCGMVPGERPEGDTHEVKSFGSVDESVEAYIMNLNTFHPYQHMRDIRQQLREQGLPIDGLSLTEGLESYSSRGEDYIDELQSMIEGNALLDKDLT